MSAARQLFHKYVPRRTRRWLRRLLRPGIYRGDYPDWATAQKSSRGYADSGITQKVIEATRAVREGRALWDRDTVLFHEPMANEPVLRALRHAAAANQSRLSVLDFGGALGSCWWQHQSWLADLAEIRWSVIEQAELVEIGQREFAMGSLRFYRSIADCCARERPNVMLLSSVLAYLEDPHRLLAEIAAGPFCHVIVDRTGFISRGPDRLTVHHVPKSIYEASYPAWFFERDRFLAHFSAEWRVVDEWVTNDDVDIDADHRGFLLERIGLASP